MLKIIQAFADDGSSRTYRVLDAWARYRAAGGQDGFCHDFAIAMLRDLADAQKGAGWSLCSGLVKGVGQPVEHTWLEHAGSGVDLGESDGQLGVWATRDRPFEIVGSVKRRTFDEALEFADELDAQLDAATAPRSNV